MVEIEPPPGAHFSRHSLAWSRDIALPIKEHHLILTTSLADPSRKIAQDTIVEIIKEHDPLLEELRLGAYAEFGNTLYLEGYVQFSQA